MDLFYSWIYKTKCRCLLQAFVVFVTMCREAYDDFVRYRRDREVNSQQYKKLTKKGPAMFDIQCAVQFF